MSEVPAAGARRFVAPTAFMWFTQVAAAIATQLVSILAPELAPALGVDPALLGVYWAIVWFTAGVVSLPAGDLSDRHGGALIGQLTVVLSIAALLLAAVAHPAAFVLMAMMVGSAWALQGPAGSRVLIRVVPPRHRSLMFSIRQTGVQFGFMIASFGLPVASLVAGWRWTALALAAAIAVLLALLRPLLREVEAEERAAAHADGPRAHVPISEGFRRVLRDPALRAIAAGAAVYAAAQFCMNAFFVVYAVGELGLAVPLAAALLGLAQFGALVARVFWGWVADRWMAPLRVLALLGAVMAASTGLLAAFPAGWPAPLLGLVVFVLGCTAGGWNGVLLAEIARRAPDAAGLVTGAVQVSNYIGLFIGPLIMAGTGAGVGFGTGYAVIAAGALAAALYQYPIAFGRRGTPG